MSISLIRKIVGVLGLVVWTVWLVIIFTKMPLTYMGPKGIMFGVWLAGAGVTFVGMIAGQKKFPLGIIQMALLGMIVVAGAIEHNVLIYYPETTILFLIVIHLMACMDIPLCRDIEKPGRMV